jgi:phospholipid/cholesterol/gamma-HCH transport system substrate-binding protein
MDTPSLRRIPRAALLALGAAALMVLAISGYGLVAPSAKHVTAYFASTKSIYPGDAVRILGVQVGKIDSITPEDTRVRVELTYDAKYRLPADAHAAIVSPTLVATRFIQLTPAYSQGPELADNGTIPIDRTVSPIEFDQLKTELTDFAKALGPDGANRDGALSRALTAIDQNGRGQGQNFHQMIVELSETARTLADGQNDFFGTVRNLAGISSELNTVDGQIADFNNQMADVSKILGDNSSTLDALIPNIDEAAGLVDRFIRGHGDQITDAVKNAGQVSRILAAQRDNLANILHAGPNALTNFNNIYNPRGANITGALDADNLAESGATGDEVCGMIAMASAAKPQDIQNRCVQYLGPLLSYLRQPPPPVGVGIPQVQGGGHYPKNGDPELRQKFNDPDQQQSGPSELPPASPPGASGLLGLMGG